MAGWCFFSAWRISMGDCALPSPQVALTSDQWLGPMAPEYPQVAASCAAVRQSNEGTTMPVTHSFVQPLQRVMTFSCGIEFDGHGRRRDGGKASLAQIRFRL